MSTKMSNAPVYYALAQVHFNPVAAMHKYVDEIQDQLRRVGYTHFETNQVAQLQFTANIGADVSQPKIETINNWSFSQADRKSGFILNNSSLTLHTTFYENREEFIPELLKALKIVDDVVRLAHISRIGLRYLDAVIPKNDESLEQYLHHGLHGITSNFGRRYSMSEIVYDTHCEPLVKNGTLVVRVYGAKSEVGFPPDLVLSGLIPNPKFVTETAVVHSIIDIDHFTEGEIPLSFDELQSQFFSQHDAIRDAFRTIATEHALSVWE